MPTDWKRRDLFTTVLVLVMLLSVILPVLGAPSFRYDEKRTGISYLSSNIVNPGQRWSFETNAAGGSMPMAGDIDGDGEVEIVYGTSDGTLYAVDENGQEEWSFQGIGPFYTPPGIADIDGDGIMEVVIGGYFQGTGDPNLYAVNGEDGSLLWTFSTEDNGASWAEGFEASPSFYDVNSDDILDVLIGTRDNNFYALNGLDGTIEWESQFEHFIRAGSPIGDIDHDGKDEILVVDNHALTRMFEMDGSIDWEIYATYSIVSTPIFADLTGDGYDEIIMFSVGWADRNIPGMAMVYDYQGNLLWSNQEHTFFYSSPTLYDVNGDGHLDILNVDSNDLVFIAYDGMSGDIIYTAEPFEGIFMSPGLITADIDGDSEIEVIVGGGLNLYSLNADDGSVDWVYDSQGNWVGGPLVVDLDGDGLAEIIVRIGGNLICIHNEIDPDDLLDDIIEYILGLPDDAFKNNPDQRKNALVNKLEEVRQMILDGDYEEAIDKLENDIRPKMDGEGKNDWIIDPQAQEDLMDMIDELIEYLESLL